MLQSINQAFKVSNILHVTYDIYLDIYKKNVLVNGCSLLAYIDTGSKLNILTLSKAQELQLNIMPSSVVMRGFGGGSSQSMGTTNITVSIDGISLEGLVHVTSCELPDID